MRLISALPTEAEHGLVINELTAVEAELIIEDSCDVAPASW
jgi:hypothetical protein